MNINEVSPEGSGKLSHPISDSHVPIRAQGCTAYILSHLSVSPSERVSEVYAKDTTWTSAALVLMAAAYMDTRCPKLLSLISGFPLPFADLIAVINDIDDWWESAEFSEYAHLQDNKRCDLNYVRYWFGGLHEEIMGRVDNQLTVWLHTARAGICSVVSARYPTSTGTDTSLSFRPSVVRVRYISLYADHMSFAPLEIRCSRSSTSAWRAL